MRCFRCFDVEVALLKTLCKASAVWSGAPRHKDVAVGQKSGLYSFLRKPEACVLFPLCRNHQDSFPYPSFPTGRHPFKKLSLEEGIKSGNKKFTIITESKKTVQVPILEIQSNMAHNFSERHDAASCKQLLRCCCCYLQALP